MNVEKIYNLTPLQEGMLYQKILDENSVAYFEQLTVVLNKKVDNDLFKKSFNLLFYQHEILRTAFFYRTAKKPLQIILKKREMEFTIIDFKKLPHSLRQENTDALKLGDQKRGFDLEKDCLFRVLLIEEEDKKTAILSFHHIILDGWSFPLVLRDLLSHYTNLEMGMKEVEIREVIEKQKENLFTFADFVYLLEIKSKDEGINYWKQELAGYSNIAEIPSLIKPNKFKNPIAELSYNFSEEITGEIIYLSKKLNITISTILEVVWGILLQKYTKENDVVFGKLLSGRNHNLKGIEQIVGMFMNTIPVRINSKVDTKILDLLKEFQQKSIEGLQYDYCHLKEIQKNTNSGKKLIRTLYVYENVYIDVGVNQYTNDLIVDAEEVIDQVEYPMMFGGIPGKRLKIFLNYNPIIYSEKQIKVIFEHIKTLVFKVLRNSEQYISELELLSDEENKLLKEKFNQEINTTLIENNDYETPHSENPTNYCEPSNQIEKNLCNLYKEVLKVDRYGVNDDFILTGGDSVKAIYIIGRAAKKGIKISIKDVYDKTIKYIANSLYEDINDISNGTMSSIYTT